MQGGITAAPKRAIAAVQQVLGKLSQTDKKAQSAVTCCIINLEILLQRTPVHPDVKNQLVDVINSSRATVNGSRRTMFTVDSMREMLVLLGHSDVAYGRSSLVMQLVDALLQDFGVTVSTTVRKGSDALTSISGAGAATQSDDCNDTVTVTQGVVNTPAMTGGGGDGGDDTTTVHTDAEVEDASSDVDGGDARRELMLLPLPLPLPHHQHPSTTIMVATKAELQALQHQMSVIAQVAQQAQFSATEALSCATACATRVIYRNPIRAMWAAIGVLALAMLTLLVFLYPVPFLVVARGVQVAAQWTGVSALHLARCCAHRAVDLWLAAQMVWSSCITTVMQTSSMLGCICGMWLQRAGLWLMRIGARLGPYDVCLTRTGMMIDGRVFDDGGAPFDALALLP